VGDIDQDRVVRAPREHALDRTDVSVARAEIGGQRDDRHRRRR
jgi:hypothetical protein